MASKQGSDCAVSSDLPAGDCGAVQAARYLGWVIGACDRPCPLRAGALRLTRFSMSKLLLESQPSARLLRAKDVAKRLSISLALSYRLIQMGEIRSVRIGTAVRVRPEDLDTFIQDNLSEPVFNENFFNFSPLSAFFD